MFWKKLNGVVQCGLCSHRCRIADGGKGFCGVRKNEKGVLYSLVYGKACSLGIDPIEKKPLFHFAPGSKTLSISTVGCNFRCDFCQNFDISQPSDIFGEELMPEEIIAMLKPGMSGISWTFTEPTVFYEYFYDTAKALSLLEKEKAPGFKRKYYNVWVSNGYTTTEALEKAGKLINAVNVDYKGDEAFYKKHCSANLEHVQEALCEYKKLGIWLEITNLIIPGHNDSSEQIKEMVQWILDNLGSQAPLHFSRFFPHHKLHADITATGALEKAAKIASDMGINYVYIGNVRHEKENTYCHNCKELIIARIGFSVAKINLKKKGLHFSCPNCNAKIPMAGMLWSPLLNK